MTQDQSTSRRIRFTVSGDVQGVGFRAFTQDRAKGMGLSGWVRNTWDGRVEGEVEGPPEALARFAQAIERGPVSGHVDRLVLVDVPALGETTAFRIVR